MQISRAIVESSPSCLAEAGRKISYASVTGIDLLQHLGAVGVEREIPLDQWVR